LSTPAGNSPTIELARLGKTYTIHEREAGTLAAVRGLIRRRTRQVAAVADLSIDIAPGEIVGFLGPNGAGKTTTLKMLSGLLYPSAGTATVAGHIPWRREKAFLRQITLVMGQRQQLVWDLPPADSFELNRAVYRIPAAEYRRALAELTDLLDLGSLLGKPVRNLSLGERMKCEVAAALLHQPRVLFLDEPTIGLDVPMQRRIRAFIAEYNRRHQATILLTSHYMADVEALCRLVVVIHHGRLLFDGKLPSLVQRFATHKTIVVELANGAAGLQRYGEPVFRDDGRVALRVPKAQTAEVTARLLADLPIVDLTIEDPPIEDVVERIFTQGAA
jgi:ABC-2 type transport system ATP-binding protein